MEQLIIQVKNKEKAKMLAEVLSALDFVSSVKIVKEKPATDERTEDFFSLAGLWENRNITAESIRQEAWPKDTK